MEQLLSRRNSIITRLTLIVGGTLVAAALVIGGMALEEQQRQLTRALETKAETLAQFMAQVSPISVLSLNFVEMTNNVKKVVLTDDEAVYAIICNEQGVPLSYYLKENDPAVTGNARTLWEGKSPLAAVLEIKRAARILEVEAPIMAGGIPIGSATVGFSFARMQHALMVQIALIGAILIIVTGVSISLLVLVLRRILHPVQVLTSAATQISTGDLNVVLTGMERSDELGVLARAFESMARQLRGLIAGMEQRMTELQDLGQALQKRENDLHQITLFQRTILDNVSYAIISTTPDGLVTSFNPAAALLLGYTAEEIVGKRTPECWHDAEEISRYARQLSAQLGEEIRPGFGVFTARPLRDEREEREWTFICKDGRRIPVNLSVSALRDDEGLVVGFVGLVYDLTERKQAEQALQDSRQRLDNIVANSPGAIYRCAHDPDWTMEFLSAGITHITGYDAGDFQGNRVRSYASIIHPDDRQLVEERIANGIERKERYEMDYRLIARDGAPRWVHEQGQGVYAPDGSLLCLDGVIFDVTALRAAEEEVRKLNRELEQRVAERTEQLEAANKELESFSYSVSHDLRSPLRAIDGFSHILQEDYIGKLDEEGRRMLGIVRDNTQRMGQLIDDILQFSRTGRLSLTHSMVDMEAMAHSVLAELQAQGDHAGLEVVIDQLPPVAGDAAMLRQVFVNLLTNAIKFSRTRARPHIEVGSEAVGDEIVYHVKDNGVGFDMQYADKLFGVFQRLHSVDEFEGTGIGLAIVKRIVTRHGGRVWAEGKVDVGATVYFALPSGPGAAN